MSDVDEDLKKKMAYYKLIYKNNANVWGTKEDDNEKFENGQQDNIDKPCSAEWSVYLCKVVGRGSFHTMEVYDVKAQYFLLIIFWS